jgi:hypothetical protein
VSPSTLAKTTRLRDDISGTDEILLPQPPPQTGKSSRYTPSPAEPGIPDGIDSSCPDPNEKSTVVARISRNAGAFTLIDVKRPVHVLQPDDGVRFRRAQN